MYTLAIAMVVVGSVCYHVCSRSVDPRGSAFASLVVTYALAIAVVASAAVIEQRMDGRAAHSIRLSWATAGLGVGVVLIEPGYVLAYRAGGKLGAASVFATTLASLALILIGAVAFGEPLSRTTLLGVLLALSGIALISWR